MLCKMGHAGRQMEHARSARRQAVVSCVRHDGAHVSQVAQHPSRKSYTEM